MGKAGINWNDFGVLSKTGINWNDMYVLGHTGINWTDLGGGIDQDGDQLE